MVSSLDQAEREAREAAEAKKRAQALHSKFNSPASAQKTRPKQPLPLPLPATERRPLCDCTRWCKCFDGSRNLTISQPAPAPAERRGSVEQTEATEKLQQMVASQVEDFRRQVGKNQRAIEAAFNAIADNDAVQDATRLGSTADRSARAQMWGLLDFQVLSGFGGPTHDQLSSLWVKYDHNRDEQLSHRELQRMLVDHAAATAAAIEERLPALRKMASAECKRNPFLAVAFESFMACEEVELELFKAHAGGNLSERELEKVFDQLDANEDGTISREEFFAGASATFFASLMQSMANLHQLQLVGRETRSEGRAVASESSKQAEIISPVLAEAQREAKQAAQDVANASRRLEKYRARVQKEVDEGTMQMLKQRDEQQRRLKAEVRSSAANVLVGFEMAKGDEAQLQARQQMWALLSKQIVSGLGPPRTHQLEALWKAYDQDCNGALSKGELYSMLTDYARARTREIERDELPAARAELEACKDNNFASAIAKAQLLAKEAEAALYRSQTDGALSDAAMRDAFNKLDANEDGTVSKAEFMAGAAGTFFHMQLVWLQRMHELDEAARRVSM